MDSKIRVVVSDRDASRKMQCRADFVASGRVCHPPPLLEGEGLACRLIEMSPPAAKFTQPVVIEVPYAASLGHLALEREIVVWRSDDDHQWYEHVLREDFRQADELDGVYPGGQGPSTRVSRIFTTTFPQYFALVSRIKKETCFLTSAGERISSRVVDGVEAVFPAGAVRVKCTVGIQVQEIPLELTLHYVDSHVGVGPVIVLSHSLKRSHKFDKPLKVIVPLPRPVLSSPHNQYYCDIKTYRLFCSIADYLKPAQFEDVTWANSLGGINNQFVEFVTTVAGKYWLVDCGHPPSDKPTHQNVELHRNIRALYREVCSVMYWIRFVVYARPLSDLYMALHVYIVMEGDDDVNYSLKTQRSFTKIGSSRAVELTEGERISLTSEGTVSLVSKDQENVSLLFLPLYQNVIRAILKIPNVEDQHTGRLNLLKDVRSKRKDGETVLVTSFDLVF